MVAFLLILALLVAIVAVMFAIQNTAPVTVTFFLWQFHQSLALVLIIAVLVGALILLLAISPSVIKRQFNSKNLKKRIVSLEKTLADEKTNREALEQELQLYRDAEVAHPPVTPVTTTPLPEPISPAPLPPPPAAEIPPVPPEAPSDVPTDDPQ